MLILSRNLKEAVIIDDSIEISIAQVDGDTVKLAIKAPKDVSIFRKEVYDVIKGVNCDSAGDHNVTLLPDEAVSEARRLAHDGGTS